MPSLIPGDNTYIGKCNFMNVVKCFKNPTSKAVDRKGSITILFYADANTK